MTREPCRRSGVAGPGIPHGGVPSHLALRFVSVALMSAAVAVLSFGSVSAAGQVERVAEGVAPRAKDDAVRVHRTAFLTESALAAPPEFADELAFAELTDIVERKDAIALYRFLEARLRRGEPGYRELWAIFRSLDRDRTTELKLLGDYNLRFALAQLPMLHENEFAEFAHWYLVASRKDFRSYLRLMAYDFAPVFVRYHGSRYPDLMTEFRGDIDYLLQQQGIDLQRVLGAARMLGHHPPIEPIVARLRDAQSLLEYQLLIDELRDRNDDAATRALANFVDERRATPGPALPLALNALASLTTERAERTMEVLLASNEPEMLFQASSAFFGQPRGDDSLRHAIRALNFPLPLDRKKALLSVLAGTNSALLNILRERQNELLDGELRALLSK